MSYPEKRNGALTGVWLAERVIDGKRVRARRATKAAADKWEQIVDATGKPPMDGSDATVAHPLGAVAKRARRERSEWKVSRDPSLDQRLEEVLTFFGPTAPVESVTHDKLLQFVAHLETTHTGRDGGKLSGKTVNRYLSVISAVVDFARDLGWTANAPKVPWQHESKGRILYFKDWQDAPMLAALAERPLQVCYEVMACSAMRPSELFEMTAEQIDLRNDWGWLRLWETKNDEARSVPIEVPLARELRGLIERGELPTHGEFYCALKAAVLALGYDADLTVYSLRHTGCTRAARKVSGAKVQKFAGHKDYNTTLNYIHLEDEDMADVAASMRGERANA